MSFIALKPEEAFYLAADVLSFFHLEREKYIHFRRSPFYADVWIIVFDKTDHTVAIFEAPRTAQVIGETNEEYLERVFWVLDLASQKGAIEPIGWHFTPTELQSLCMRETSGKGVMFVADQEADLSDLVVMDSYLDIFREVNNDPRFAG